MPRIVLYLLLSISVLLTVAGVRMIVTGAKDGWLVSAFFGFCTAVAVWQLWPQLLEPPPVLSVEEMVSRYPGPVELRMSIRKTVFVLVGILVFGSCMLWFVLTHSLDGIIATMFWIGIAFIALGIAVFLIILLRGSSLRLEGDGFTVSHGLRRWSVPWKAATGFTVACIPPAMTEIVVYDDATRPAAHPAKIALGITSCNSALPDNYGLPHPALAELMALWRELAVVGDLPSYPPDHDDA